ncbi:hypothetical protein [Sphingopyxis macrogoltabida]|uniref:Uncharacterized protein n=1 Tax=Sphingopyxis macrogoltabida TaxID=33050 RepID=A0AAC8YX80_SPHMC|nr:hypothetical protein [Sphingopyxis macrogoltabida]ALJ11602.1 hypothetical protein LH19_01870 [Sphingopyxis macrogoltabida]AMU87791.1 hypothetical protein ATM17_01850 [Sphingopyxis macrogoltabida]
MYAFVDRPVETLCNSGRFLLWAMRGWTAAVARRNCPPQALHNGFAAVGALPALSEFHAAMISLGAGAREEITLAPMRCRQIGEDEAILIALWHDMAQDRVAAAQATLALLVEPGRVVPASTALAAASLKLAAAGFTLSPHSMNHQENRS